jgi:EAL domain-containing protein (putative c-di-GMP-specific phosphodiesterase class I)/GGDEF domain-containing protein
MEETSAGDRIGTNGIKDGVSPSTLSRLSADSDVALVCSHDGTICAFHCRSEKSRGAMAEAIHGSPVEAVWADARASVVRKNIKRTLRSRGVHCVDFEDKKLGQYYEFLFVAQGRDRVLVIARDVSEKKADISQIRKLAYADEITGLPNREFLMRELGRIVDELRLTSGRAAIICFNISQPDLVGSSAGKAKNEAILKEIGTRLRAGLRGVNSLTEKDIERYSVCARVDFHDFAVVLPRIESGSDAAAVTERMTTLLGQPIRIGTRESRVKVAAGIALFPQDGTDAETLYANGCTAMEDAVNNQSTRLKFHSGTVKVRALKRQDMEQELKAALDREEFTVNYLPIVKAGTREVAAVEALLRWPQEVFGAQPIRKIVTLAEHTGLIVPIGEWVLHQSCRQLRHWQNAGHTDLRLSVNLSVQEFSKPGLADSIEAILGQHGVEPHQVDFDITEHILFRDAMKDFVTSRELKALGSGVVVDDYGTGVCSLAHLSTSPVDTVKIDGSFVAGSGTSDSDRAACNAATAMAHALSLKVVAEGVETAEQAALLEEIGCDYLQGFLFLKPAPADEVSDYLDSSAMRHEVV